MAENKIDDTIMDFPILLLWSYLAEFSTISDGRMLFMNDFRPDPIHSSASN